MLDAQAAVIDHLVEVVRAESVDAVLVAGDVYDRALPGVDVVAPLDEALARPASTGATVVLSSGNHDSPRRLGFAARLLERSRVHVRAGPARRGEPVLLGDRHGPAPGSPASPRTGTGPWRCTPCPTSSRRSPGRSSAARRQRATRRSWRRPSPRSAPSGWAPP